MTQSDEARRELASFLRSRRAKLSPADVGLACGRGRRTPGLRREEVATLSGIGLTWYVSLEQGKPIQVSSAFLENIARGLRLSAPERAHLFALAQHRPPPLSPAVQEIPDDGLQPILDSLAGPAYARTDRFDVVAWNAANTAMFGDFAAIPAAERNVIRLMFLRDYHRRSMPDWRADARALLAKFRVNLGQAVDKTPFWALIDELTSQSDEFKRLWAEHEVLDSGEGVTRFQSRRHGMQYFRHHLLMPESWPNLRIVLYVARSAPALA